jgi:hypothetical protein
MCSLMRSVTVPPCVWCTPVCDRTDACVVGVWEEGGVIRRVSSGTCMCKHTAHARTSAAASRKSAEQTAYREPAHHAAHQQTADSADTRTRTRTRTCDGRTHLPVRRRQRRAWPSRRARQSRGPWWRPPCAWRRCSRHPARRPRACGAPACLHARIAAVEQRQQRPPPSCSEHTRSRQHAFDASCSHRQHHDAHASCKACKHRSLRRAPSTPRQRETSPHARASNTSIAAQRTRDVALDALHCAMACVCVCVHATRMHTYIGGVVGWARAWMQAGAGEHAATRNCVAFAAATQHAPVVPWAGAVW